MLSAAEFGRLALKLRVAPVVLSALLLVVGGCASTSGPDQAEDGFSAPQMIVVPAGTFMMGAPDLTCADVHQVELTNSFELAKYELTNQEYIEALQWAYDQGHITVTATEVQDNLDGSSQKLMGFDDLLCEISFADGVFSLHDAGHGLNPDHPTGNVTWFGAARYCDWLSLSEGLPRAYEHDGDWLCNGHDPYGATGYRLPTEAEWEYAAQYSDGRAYPWGDESPDCDHANYRGCIGWSLAVGSCPDGNSALGFCDLAGNKWEWCNDWYVCSLGDSARIDPVGATSGTARLVRSCSWGAPGDTPLRCSDRSANPPDAGVSGSAIRVARTMP